MVMLTYLGDVLRNAGLKVIEEPGWETRGHGEMGQVVGCMLHHTGGPIHGEDPSLDTVLKGRPDLAGPLAQLFLARSGTYHIIAAGKCWHAGKGYWHGYADGNGQFIGIEAENAGTGQDHWPLMQLQAYTKGVAALLMYLKQDSVMACGHKEYALPKGRKIDPSFDMITFRQSVEVAMSGTIVHLPAPAATQPERSMLRKGDMGDSVKMLQHALKITPEDGNFGPKTEAAVKSFQTKEGLTADGLVGPQTWAKLGY